MRFLSVKHRITLGLTSILVSSSMLLVFFGYGPDPRREMMRGRKKVCESIAVSSSIFVSQNGIDQIEKMLGALVERDDDLLSAAVRRTDGRTLIAIGDHDHHWESEGIQSTETHVQVPLWSGDSRWGSVELCFRPIMMPGLIGMISSPWTIHLALLGAMTFLSYSFYLGRVLRQLDPSQAIPKRVRSALDALAEGLLVTDQHGCVALANESFAKWAGQEPEALIGRKAKSFPWQRPANVEESLPYPWIRALELGIPQSNYVMELCNVGGTPMRLIANSSPVLGHDGKYRGVLTSFQDVTELEHHKQELSEAKEAADAASQSKSEFLARMSHEIRTPMNAILGYTEVLRHGFAENEKQRDQYLRTIQNSGEHLLALINDILDLSKVEAGRMELEMARYSPHEVLYQVVSVLRVKAEEKGLDLQLEADGKLPETIRTDAVRLRQAIINLVGNAIKFTESGSVRVVARMMWEPRELFLIDVVDTGVGISEDALTRIFEPFSQADTSITRRFGGTGLGLAISRQLVEKMGGEISVKSEPGHGTTFTITVDPGPLEGVPLVDMEDAQAAMQHQREPEEVDFNLPPAHVLVVDDSPENRQLAALFMRRAGLEVTSAENGQIAIELVSANNFDAILMDMQMPVMDGITATKLLRELGCTTPIISLTANVMKDDERKCREAGCDAFLTKPIKMKDLLETLRRFLVATDEDATKDPIQSLPLTAKVDSQPKAISSPQRNNGDEQCSAATPASNKLQLQGQAPVVSSLPMDDVEFRHIVEGFIGRLNERMPEFRTAASQGDMQELGELAHWLKGAAGSLGFDDLVAPAAELQKIAEASDTGRVASTLSVIGNLVERIRMADATTEQEPVANTKPGVRTEISDAESLQQSAFELLSEVREAQPVVSSLPMDDPEFREIVGGFVGRLHDQIPKMREAADNNKLAELAELAHWLKGSGGSLGFEELINPAAELQTCAESGDRRGVEIQMRNIEKITRRIEIPISS